MANEQLLNSDGQLYARSSSLHCENAQKWLRKNWCITSICSDLHIDGSWTLKQAVSTNNNCVNVTQNVVWTSYVSYIIKYFISIFVVV